MSLNLHNRHVDDQGAGEGEVLLEGVDAEMMEAEEAEDMGQDLFDSVVCKKNYEEPGQRGSAAEFLLGEEIEGDPPGREEVEAGAQHLLEINDSNKCHSSSIESSPAVNSTTAVSNHPEIDCEVEDDILPAAEKKTAKKMPKTKKKFGRGAIRGSNRKEGRVNATTFARGNIPSVTVNQPVKYMTKAQLSKSLVETEVRTVMLFFNI